MTWKLAIPWESGGKIPSPAYDSHPIPKELVVPDLTEEQEGHSLWTRLGAEGPPIWIRVISQQKAGLKYSLPASLSWPEMASGTQQGKHSFPWTVSGQIRKTAQMEGLNCPLSLPIQSKPSALNNLRTKLPLGDPKTELPAHVTFGSQSLKNCIKLFGCQQSPIKTHDDCWICTNSVTNPGEGLSSA